jgi:transposase InsO family protein
VSITAVCRQLGFSRQAYHKSLQNRSAKGRRENLIKEHVCLVRRQMPRLGTRKLQYLLNQQSGGNRGPVGRDWLFNFLKTHGLLVKRKRKYIKTTDSSQWRRQYPNRIKNYRPNKPEQVWVADITYLLTQQGTLYLHLLTDAYSKKIVGYEVSQSLAAIATGSALKAALAQRQYAGSIIHHSDRGSQYCSQEYTDIQKQAGMKTSMTQDGSPYDNAIAERINGILKQEYGLDEIIADERLLKSQVKHAINSYNTQRPHLSCSMLTPEQMHRQHKLPIKTWEKKSKTL